MNDLLMDPNFLEQNFQKKAFHQKTVSQSRFEHLFGYEQLNGVLNSSMHPHPQMKLALRGKQFQPQTQAELIHSVQQGATLIIENIDWFDRKLGTFLDLFSSLIDEKTRLNMYMSQSETKGYGIHYDTQDFFILQIDGKKRWFVYPATTESVLFNQKHHDTIPPTEDEMYLECVLEPGDLLYVPRGHWHHAVAEGGASIHLTLAMFYRTGIDFMHWLVDELTDDELFRRVLPATLTGADKKEHLHSLASALSYFIRQDDIDSRYEEATRALRPDRNAFHFPRHIMECNNICENAREFEIRPLSVKITREREKMRVAVSGRVLIFDQSCESVIEYIFAKRKFTTTEITGHLGQKELPDYVLKILARLVHHGFCEIKS